MLQVLPSFQFVFLSDEITGYKFRLCYNWHAIFYLMNILNINENLYNFLCFNSMHFLRRLKPFHLTYISRFCPLNGLYTNFVGFFFCIVEKTTTTTTIIRIEKPKLWLNYRYFSFTCASEPKRHTHFNTDDLRFLHWFFPVCLLFYDMKYPYKNCIRQCYFFPLLSFTRSHNHSLTHSLSLSVVVVVKYIFF